jgi:hypothetical protein
MFKRAAIYEPTEVEVDAELHEYTRLRVFTIYRLPADLIDILVFNNDLFETIKTTACVGEYYRNERKPLPKYFESFEEFNKVSWKYAIGYTTEDVWER